MCEYLLKKCIGKIKAIFITTIIGGILSLLDVYTDVAVMIEWYSNKDYWWASGILFFVLLSHTWSVYVMYGPAFKHAYGQSAVASVAMAQHSTSKCALIIHATITFLGFSSFQLLYRFYNIIQRDREHMSDNDKEYENFMYYKMKVRVGRFKFLESVFESIPNGALQIYFIYTITNGNILTIDWKQQYLTIISIILSIVSVGKGISKWIKINAMRNASRKAKNVQIFDQLKLVRNPFIDVLSSIYFASDYVWRVLSLIFIWIVCKDNSDNKRWMFAIVVIVLVCWQAIACKIVIYFWGKSGLKFPGGLAKNLSSWIFHIIASVFTVYYYNGVRPTTAATLLVVLSQLVINMGLFIVYYELHATDSIVENWNLIYLCVAVINVLTLFVWLYFKYKVIRLLYLGDNRNLAAYGQTAMRTQERSFDRKGSMNKLENYGQTAVATQGTSIQEEHVEQKETIAGQTINSNQMTHSIELNQVKDSENDSIA